jgi:hypothetical protein
LPPSAVATPWPRARGRAAAAHGSRNCRQADDDYLAVVETLLAAGADGETAINRWGEDPEGMASPRIAARLRRWAEAQPSNR